MTQSRPTSTFVLSVLFIVAACHLPKVHAEDFAWSVLGGGVQTWQSNANWAPSSGFPNANRDLANLSVPLTAALGVDIGASSVTLGRLDIGSTGAAVQTDVTGTGAGAFLQFTNVEDPDFEEDNDVDGNDFLVWQRGLGVGTTNATGDANGDGKVAADDLRSWRELFARGGTSVANMTYAGVARINSQGVTGATNRISVPVRSGAMTAPATFLSETVEVRGAQSLNLAGGFQVLGDQNSISSFLPTGATLTLNGVNTKDQSDGTTDRLVLINNGATAAGRVELNGATGGGTIFLGNTSNTGVVSNIVLHDSSAFTGTTTQNRSNLILASNAAFGSGRFQQGNPSQRLGFNLMSDDDSRRIANVMAITQWQTVTGEHSLDWAGVVGQDNSRGWVNLLPAGKTLTLSGNQYAVTDTDTARPYVFDGSGTTIVTGAMSGQRYSFSSGMENTGADSITASLVKQGTGALYLNGANTYAGTTTVNGGSLHFGKVDENTQTSQIIDNFGAIGIDTGDSVLTNFFFLSRFAPNSSGGLMLRASDAAATVDYSTGDLGTLTGGGANLSLAAPETGLTFTGSILPAGATYRLGGGSGTLTLPNAQMTGANRLVATNGGVVQLNGANSFTGGASALAKYTTSLTAQALVNGPANDANLNRVFGGTVLATTNLQNGGAPSGIGASSSDAANLVMQGSTFRYNGTGASTIACSPSALAAPRSTPREPAP